MVEEPESTDEATEEATEEAAEPERVAGQHDPLPAPTPEATEE